MRLPWTECPCGCQGRTFGFATTQLWMGEEVRGYYTLRAGHGSTGTCIGDFKTFDEANEFAHKWAKPRFEKLKIELQELEKYFAA